MSLVPPTVPEKPGPTTSTPTTAKVVSGEEYLKRFSSQKPIQAKIAEITSSGLVRLTLSNGNLIAQINGNIPSTLKTISNVSFYITDKGKNIKFLSAESRQTSEPPKFKSLSTSPSSSTISLPLIKPGIKITAEIIPHSIHVSAKSTSRNRKSKQLSNIGIVTNNKTGLEDMRQLITTFTHQQNKIKVTVPEFLNLFNAKNKLKPNKEISNTRQKLLETSQLSSLSNRPKPEISTRLTNTQKIIPNFFRITNKTASLAGVLKKKTSLALKSKHLTAYQQTESSIGAKRGFQKLKPNEFKVSRERDDDTPKNTSKFYYNSPDTISKSRQTAITSDIVNVKTTLPGSNMVNSLKTTVSANFNQSIGSANNRLSYDSQTTPVQRIRGGLIKTSKQFGNAVKYTKTFTDIRVLSVFDSNKIIKTPAKLNRKANLTGVLVAQTPSGQSVIETKDNIFILNGTLNYPRGTRVALEVPNTLLSPSLRVTSQLPSPFTLSSPYTWPSLENIFEKLKVSNNASIYNDFRTNRLSEPGKKLTATMALFLSAIRTGDARAWLGHRENSLNYPVREAILQTLYDDFNVMQRASEISENGWRAFFIPILDENQISLIQFFIRQQQEKNHKALESLKRKPTQFVVELTLNAIGNMQIDGRVGDKNVELVIRTRKPIQQTLKKGIEKVFFSTLNNSELTGTLSFKVQTKLSSLPVNKLNDYIEKSISSTLI